MNRRKIVYLLCFTVMTLGISGCSKYNNLVNVEVVESFEDMVFDEKKSIYDIKSYIDENISSTNDLEMSSSMVNTYIYALYQNVEKYINIVSELQDDFACLESELNLDEITVSDLSKIPREYKLVRAIVEELKECQFILFKENNAYTVDVDIQEISNRYSKYVNKDTLEYLKFRVEERAFNVYDINSDTYDIKALMKTIDTVIEKMNELEGSSQKNNWVETLTYYLNIFTSRTQETFVDKDKRLVPNILKEMREYQKSHANSEFVKFIKEYTDILEINNYETNSEPVRAFLEGIDSELESFLIEKK